MPRRRMMDYMMRDGRNPYGSAGGYISRTRPRGRDRAMNEDMARGRYGRRDYGNNSNDYAEYNRGQYNRDYAENNIGRYNMDYEQSGQYDMARGNYDMRDMHYGRGQYQPVEAMGYFTGYYGGGDDYARGGRGRGRDYGYDYGYDYAGDYGERLTKEELEEWKEKLLKEVDSNERQFFTKEQIGQKAKQLGVEMKDYNEEELVVATAMVYTDYCKTAKKYIGNNMNFFIELAKDWLEDKDSAVKGGEKLAIYYDCIIMAD